MVETHPHDPGSCPGEQAIAESARNRSPCLCFWSRRPSFPGAWYGAVAHVGPHLGCLSRCIRGTGASGDARTAALPLVKGFGAELTWRPYLRRAPCRRRTVKLSGRAPIPNGMAHNLPAPEAPTHEDCWTDESIAPCGEAKKKCGGNSELNYHARPIRSGLFVAIIRAVRSSGLTGVELVSAVAKQGEAD